MSDAVETFQIPLEIAEVYESRFVPRLFGVWAPHLIEAAGVKPGHRVLDVACGTGIVTRLVADLLGGRGAVVGVDLNENMLEVARRVRPDIEWRKGDAQDLPFDDASFDVVLCQSALIFFPDLRRALAEMARVVVPGGTVAVQGWSSLQEQPAYRPLVDVAARHAGPDATRMLSTYWSVGDLDRLGGDLTAAGLRVTRTQTHVLTSVFDSIEELVRTEVESTPLVQRISDEVYRSIIEDAGSDLARFETRDGHADIPVSGYVVTAFRA